MDGCLQQSNRQFWPEISNRNFRPLLVVMPLVGMMSIFENLLAPLFERIENNERQSQTLAELRGSLLPKLIFGEVRILESLCIVGLAA
jgi:type I restriction enzyme S subunit